MLTRDELKDLPRGAVVFTKYGDIMMKSGRHNFVVLASDFDKVGDSYFASGLDRVVVGEIGGDQETAVRAALATIDDVRKQIGAGRD